ncbi:serine/threonine-protein kinase [Embleya sp. NPDC056575]|uniref:serine/threonine-protein kinase n=1 Tax=unclassified Embleya TaxID=2699296 RepID=UPI0036A4C25C
MRPAGNPPIPPSLSSAFQPLASGDPQDVGGYRLAARLGAGGMGRVYLAHTPGGRPVALKVVRPEYAEDPQFRARFAQEVAGARRIHGLYTAQVVDADPHAEVPWLATAYVPGPSLRQVVERYGPLPIRTVLLLVGGIAEALREIHRVGVVHRDLKPGNVIAAADGPRVIDFGIARAADAVALTGTGVCVGTPAFMAPEQAVGRHVTPAADVFALGALGVFIAGGVPPFGAGADSAQMYRLLHDRPDLGTVVPELHALLGYCLAKDPAARPTPAELVDLARAHPAAGGHLRFTDGWLPDHVGVEIERRSNTAGPGPAPQVPEHPAPGDPGPPLDGAADGYPLDRTVADPGQPDLRDTSPLPGPPPTGAGIARAGGRGRRRTSVGAVLAGLVVAAVGSVVGLSLLDELDPDTDETAAAHQAPAVPAASPMPTTGAPGSSSPSPSPPVSPPVSSPMTPAESGYTAIYAEAVLTAPDDGYDFDIASGSVRPAESTKWAIGHNNGEFLIPAGSDAAVMRAETTTPEECVAALDRRPIGIVTFRDVAAGQSFCVRSRTTRELALVRVVAAAGGSPVEVGLTAYRPRR